VIAFAIIAIVVVAVLAIPISYVVQARRRHQWQAEAARGETSGLHGTPSVPEPLDPASRAEGEMRAMTRDIGFGR
jgi:hypothetical protein